MSENKTGKYFKYAIGEIVLVVIGILIALQINSWNDYRKDRKNEQLILSNFKNNLNSDIQLLKSFQEKTSRGINAVDTTLLMINNQIEFNFFLFANNIEKVISNTYFQSNSTTFDLAISTGKIDLIINDSIRNEILNYYKLTKLNFDDNRILETNQDFVFPTIFSSVVATNPISSIMTGINTDFPELDLKNLASSPEFNTWMIFKKEAYKRQTQNYMLLEDTVTNLIILIDKQLGK